MNLAASSDAATNAYLVALIAVGGTIVGAAISGVVQALTTSRSARYQRDAMMQQLTHETEEGIRQERRRVYARFLLSMEAYNMAFLNAQEVASAVRAGRTESKAKEALSDDAANEEEVTLPPKLLEQISSVYDQFREALCEVELIAGSKVSDAALTIFAEYGANMANAKMGEYHHGSHESSQVHPVAIIALMQEELGITGGWQIDPTTGLRIRPSGNPG